jgi:hypothetical protein
MIINNIQFNNINNILINHLEILIINFYDLLNTLIKKSLAKNDNLIIFITNKKKISYLLKLNFQD